MDANQLKLDKIEQLIDDGLSTQNMLEILHIIGVDNMDADTLESIRLWGDYLPRADEYPYTQAQRYMHILWETIDKVPLGINCAFTIPFRAIIAKRLFKKCGKGFIANEGCRFNYGHLIEIGDNVTWNHCCYIDAKGGVEFKDFSMITEYSKIFTHGHSESNHMERTYKRVEIGEYAKIYTNATILAGVKIGKGAVVATGTIVTKDVPDFTVVAGIPAKPIRERHVDDKENLELLNHYTLKEKWFQSED